MDVFMDLYCAIADSFGDRHQSILHRHSLMFALWCMLKVLTNIGEVRIFANYIFALKQYIQNTRDIMGMSSWWCKYLGDFDYTGGIIHTLPTHPVHNPHKLQEVSNHIRWKISHERFPSWEIFKRTWYEMYQIHLFISAKNVWKKAEKLYVVRTLVIVYVDQDRLTLTRIKIMQF